ncbi:hypothetical protein Bbelb_386970 [Branchiostoma belcheri]|nr:hypothetical protein Bbelb_386970 [Branchiostoma belcheri]
MGETIIKDRHVGETIIKDRHMGDKNPDEADRLSVVREVTPGRQHRPRCGDSLLARNIFISECCVKGDLPKLEYFGRPLFVPDATVPVLANTRGLMAQATLSGSVAVNGLSDEISRSSTETPKTVKVKSYRVLIDHAGGILDEAGIGALVIWYPNTNPAHMYLQHVICALINNSVDEWCRDMTPQVIALVLYLRQSSTISTQVLQH